MDYPGSLQDFFGRRIWKAKLGWVRQYTSNIFVKPIEHKLFTGFVWNGCTDEASRRRVVCLEDDVDVWVSDTIEILSEYQCIVLDGKILDVRKYKGDWSKAPNRDTVESAVKSFSNAPISYCLDVGVVKDKTLIIEVNDGFSFGHYGLHHADYARCLSARWEEMASAL